MSDGNIKSTLLFFILISISVVTIQFEYAKSQTITSTDPKQILKEFKIGKDSIQKDIQINFNQLINEVKTQLNFNSVDSHLSLASLYFVNGKISEGLSELEIANKEWKNSSITIINAGNEFVSIGKNNSTNMSDSTRQILDHFGNILINMGKKIEDLRLELAK